MPTRGPTVELMLSSTTTAAHSATSNPRGAPLRASWAAASGSTKVGWSGKAMTMTESKKFLEVLMSAPEDVTGQLVESLPNQFVSLGIDEAAMASVADATGGEGKDGGRSEDREVLLGEIVEGPLEDGVDA